MECASEPAGYVPVTMIVYVPAGVPPLPVLVLLPPHATWKVRPTTIRQASTAATSVAFPAPGSERRRAPIGINPISGRQSAYNSPELPGWSAPLGPVVVTVSVAGVPGAAELGAMLHAGASTGAGATEHVSATEPLNPPCALKVNVELAAAPGLRLLGLRGETDNEKSGGSRLKVAKTTSSAVPEVTLHEPVPEQGPFQPAKVEFEAAVAVSDTAAPGARNAEQTGRQLITGGFPTTVPVPVPAAATVTA